MKPKIKAQWLAALRSGEYQQGQERLRDEENRFCCLGVLCDIAAKQGLGKWRGLCFEVGHEVNAGAFLHPAVADWAGLELISPRIDSIPLTAFNDGEDEEDREIIHPHTFAQIADLIEQHL